MQFGHARIKRGTWPSKSIATVARLFSSMRRRTRIPINDLFDYWVDISKRPAFTKEDYALFFERAEITIAHFSKFYPLMRDRFLEGIKALPLFRDGLLKEASKNNRLVHMKDTAKKFIPRIKKWFEADIVDAISKKTPLQDAEALLATSTKLTYRWAAGIIISNHLALLLIQLSRFGGKPTDDIKTLYDNLKTKATNPKLKTFLVRSYRRFEDADKLRNRCAHVIEGEPTKQEIEQSIALARLLQKHAPRKLTRPADRT
jgi:hypothetical protein